jgi:predicted phage terminase large subunit-like protein
MHRRYTLSPKQIAAVRLLIQSYFKNKKGEPFNPTDSQCVEFASIIDQRVKWLWISAPTRYGKSEMLGMAVLYCAAFLNLKIPIVGGSIDKANKIMEYIIGHVADHPVFHKGLINLDLSQVEKLKVTISKDTLRWADGGWIFVTSIDSRQISKEGEGVVGEGGDIVVLEEAGLIKSKDQFSKVVRMPEEDRGWGKLIQNGNCIEGSVFEAAYKNPLYIKVRIDLETAIREGRYSRQRVEEVRLQTTSKDWKRYWLVQFPAKGEFAYFKPKSYEFLPRDLKYYGAIDPALGGVEKAEKQKIETGSKIGIAVLGVDKDFQKYEVEVIVDHMTPDEAIRKIFNMPYKFTRFAFEAIAFQKYFLKETKIKSKEQGVNIPFEGMQQSKNKIERIESMEPPINTGQVLFKGEGQIWDDLMDYPKVDFLDGLDVLEMAHRISEVKKPSFAIGDDVY